MEVKMNTKGFKMSFVIKDLYLAVTESDFDI